MRILLVEDDHLQFGPTLDNLEREFHGASFTRIRTESEFRAKFKEIAANKPDVIIMDVMLPWDDPDPDLKVPEDVLAGGGIGRAGIRCKELLAGNEQTRDIPVFFYTVLDNPRLQTEIQNLHPRAEHLIKEPDSADLIERIRALLAEKAD
jgi:CheY-like chemotaxis protein